MRQQVISCGGGRDEKVARVEDGVVIPTGIRTTTVRVTAGDSDISDTCRVTVSALPAELEFQAEDREAGINGCVAGTTKSAAGETLIWLIQKLEYRRNAGSLLVLYGGARRGRTDSALCQKLSKEQPLNISVNGEIVVENMMFGNTGDSIVCAEQPVALELKEGR